MPSVSWTIPRIWPGETVVVVAGGPSLTLKDVHRVAIARAEGRCRVMAVNDAVFPCWWADWLHACDAKWWLWHKDHGVDRFPGIKTTNIENAMTARWGVHYVRHTGHSGFEPDTSAIRSGRNGAYCALHMGVHAGATRVLMLGVDLKEGKPGASHWFGDHPEPHDQNFAGMLRSFRSIVDPLKERAVEVINCSPDSALDCFPKARLEEVI